MNEIMSSTAASYFAYQPQTYSPLNSEEVRPVTGAEVIKVNQPNANEQTANEKNPDTESQSSKEQDSDEQAKQVIAQLEARDREVRAHEQAHLAAAAGPHARGGINYEYQTGPDGKSYAVGGSVNIDTSPVADDPEATLQKAQVVQRAALAPADPSGQDMAVAAQAAQMMQQAQQEIREQAIEKDSQETDTQSIKASDELGLVVNTRESSEEITDNLQQQVQAEQQDNIAARAKQEAVIPQRNEFDLRVSLQALDT